MDELADLEKVYAVQGQIVIKTNECRAAKEDAHRAAGNAGDALTYRLPTPIQGFRVFAFFPHEVAHLKFSLSADGRNFQQVKADKNEYFQGAGDYNYWKPVLYHADGHRPGRKLPAHPDGRGNPDRAGGNHARVGQPSNRHDAMNPNDLKDFSSSARDQLFGHIIPFWCGPAVDHEQGGWMGWLSNDLKPDRTQPKGLIIHCRILWTFSAVHRARPEKTFPTYGRPRVRLPDEPLLGCALRRRLLAIERCRAEVLDDSKKIYGQAFFIYALAEYHRAFGAPAALAKRHGGVRSGGQARP